MMTISVLLPILIRAPWQRHLTEAAIRIARDTTAIPFELVILETESADFRPNLEGQADRYGLDTVYLQRTDRTSLVKDINAAIDAASGDYLVQFGNDLVVQPGWLEAMLECFERYKDCGAATIGIREVGAAMNQAPQNVIVEGMYGPLMMFRKGWRLDEGFESFASDSDLVMRMYQSGLRAYRNLKVTAYHLHMATWSTSLVGEAQQKAAAGNTLFAQKWGDSPLWMAKMVLNGAVIFGHEHERVTLR